MGPDRDTTSGDAWDLVRELDPDFYEASRRLADVPRRHGHLEPKVRAFVALAVDAAVTHLHEPGVRQHVEAAVDAGATELEVMEVLECASTVSIHAMNVGVPVLVEVLGERGDLVDAPPDLDDRRQQIKDDFARRRGYWNATWEALLRLDPDMFEAYTELSSVPWDHGHLEPVVKELMYIAFDTSVTHLYQVGLKLHVENALALGATPEQVLEVMEIASLIGLRAATTGARAILEIRESGR